MKRFALLVISCLTAGVIVSAAPPADGAKTYKGYISDTQCGANVDAACNRRCFEQGRPPVLVVDGSGDLIDIANADKVTSLPGAHVEIRGKMDANKLTVLDVKELQD